MPYSFEKGRYIHDFPPFPDQKKDILLTPTQGLEIERNLLTMATSRSGKGAAQIVPNLRHWAHNALVIDPKGEAAILTWKDREAMGQKVYVLDPFNSCEDKIPHSIKAQLNPLDEIDINSPHAFRQINAIADGLVMRHKKEDGFWDSGTCQLLAGMIAHVLTHDRFEGRRTLTALRETLTGETLETVIDEMAGNPACGRLPINAANKLMSTGKAAESFITGADTNTSWIDDPLIETLLEQSDFKLQDLKRGKVTIYLVLPFEALDDYGRFLRLFVRMALFQMMQKMPNGGLKGERCLFILDEFFSLGRINEISKAAGGMPGFNLHLWPFLQDYPQLSELYGQHASKTFLGNADGVFAYGVNEDETAEYVSKATGLITADDLGVKPPDKPKYPVPPRFSAPKGTLTGFFQRLFNRETPDFQFFRQANIRPEEKEQKQTHDVTAANKHDRVAAEWRQTKDNAEADYQDKQNQYKQAESMIGKPRLTMEEAMVLTEAPPKKVSPNAFLIKSGVCYKIKPVGYWEG